MNIDPKQIKELRDMTGAGIVECKNALAEANLDINKACEILMKKGILRADKYSSKTTTVGFIGTYIHNGRVGALVELDCETDFVARNTEFQELLHDLCLHIVGMKPLAVDKDNLDPNFIKQQEEIIREQLKDSLASKPAEVQKKMVEGKLNKDIIKSKCLLEQDFVNQDRFKGTVKDYIKSKIGKFGENIKVARFSLFELGKETVMCEASQTQTPSNEK
ncbi:MAG: elongation factor Ts [Planctomycetes bacterium]|nr:elongation factor Ts [Planctomycetota bacterium]